ncbi:MAG: hypothetical protein GX663_02815 [Clostridiales bacterium]|nr:hypothetical protein [Clostridiales bacterium]
MKFMNSVNDIDNAENEQINDEAVKTEEFNTKKNKEPLSIKRKYIVIAFVSFAVLVIVAFVCIISNLLFPVKAEQNQASIFIISGESAKTEMNFINSSGTDKELVLDYGQGEIIKKNIPADGNKKIELNFGRAQADTSIEVKYGFLGLKKIQTQIIVVEPAQLSFSAIRIRDKSGTDITQKKYCEPNSKVIFEAEIRNNSKKAFEREYQLVINKKVMTTKVAKWTESGDVSVTLAFKHDFKEQGLYEIKIGNSKINFICSTNDTPPANGTVLLNNNSGGKGVLKINSKYNNDIIVTLAQTSSLDKAEKRIFLKANGSATISGVKDGTYVIYVKGGKGYSNVAKDILEPTSAYKSTDSMKFESTASTYSIWTLDLGVQGGNTGITSIDNNSIPNN